MQNQYCLADVTEKAMATHSSTLAWKIPWMEEPGRLHAVHGVAKSRTWLSDFTFTFHFHALDKKMATHSSILAWKIPGTAEPGGLPSMGSHRVGHNWSDLAAAAADVKSWLIWKDPDAGKDWGQEVTGMTEDEMVWWHHQLSGHEFGQTPGVGDGQGGLVCRGSWGLKESEMTERLNWTDCYHYFSPKSCFNKWVHLNFKCLIYT